MEDAIAEEKERLHHDRVATARAVKYIRCDVLRMTQTQLARALDVSVTTVQNWEAGKVAQLKDEQFEDLKRVVREHDERQARKRLRAAA
jgi:DNA-binding transcriptional regulator YiaG